MKTNTSLRAFLLRRASPIVLLCFLGACAGGGGSERGQMSQETGHGYYKVGKPYQINGVWYYPKVDYSYDETGIASWYGDDFHKKATANDEVYNKGELTAAHRTLPLPSLARVTNLENGRAIVVRINDRGPFSKNRVIDVSQRSAQLLGFEGKGTAKVRVQVLADESRAIAEAMHRYGSEPDEAQPYIADNNERVAKAYMGETSPKTSATPQPHTLSLPSQAAPAEPLPTMANVRPVAEYVQLPVTGAGDIYIQAGSFSQAENAKKLKDKLASFGKTSIAEASVKGTTYYRVRLGPIQTVPQADSLLKKVLKSGADTARIVVE